MQEKNAKSFVDPEMTKRLISAIDNNFKSKAQFAKQIGATYEAVRLWCDGQSKPSSDFLFSIASKTNISIDWLLTGKKKDDDFMCGWDERSRAACQKLKEILDSGDKFAVPAILSNIDAFRDSVDKNTRLERLEKAINELEKKDKYNNKLATLKLNTDTG